jgi:cysteinyl-tRNA synthetase
MDLRRPGARLSTSAMLTLKNTYAKAVQPFEPLDPAGKTVLLYSCGPTVYSFAHIGNFRSFLVADILRRTLERLGYRVRQVMNITDVGHMTQDHLADATGEDKLSKAARELGWDPYEVAAHYERAFVEDAKALRLAIYEGESASDASLHPRATAHVAEMLVMIQRLLDRGFAYVDSRGQVYFEVSAFPEYGTLSGKVLDDLEAGARVAVREEKRDPRDFALWKVDEKHLMTWDPHGPEGWPSGDYARFRELAPGGVDSRLRPGFPGWHIECSAMARAHLGEIIDVHTGGEDNIFPHHECEIAQSYGAADVEPAPKTFSRFWVHGRHLLVDGKKMSKSEGSFFTPRDLFDPRAAGRADLGERLEGLGFPGGKVPPAVLRYALISNQYLQPMNFTFDALAQAKASVERIQTRYARLVEEAGEGAASAEVIALVAKHSRAFDEGLEDNLNMPNALAALFGFIGELNQRTLTPGDAAAAKSAMEGFDTVLAVLDRRARSGIVTKEELERGGVAVDAGAATERSGSGEAGTLEAAEIEAMILRRHAAKKGRDFAAADAVRKELEARGVGLEDLPVGVRWRVR